MPRNKNTRAAQGTGTIRKKTVTRNGKPYEFIPDVTAECVVIYDKSTIEAQGLDDPWDLYEAGEWNWDTFKSMLEEKGLTYEMVTEFTYSLIMSANNPLAQKEEIHYQDLEPYMQISHADPYVPSLPAATVLKDEHTVNCSRNIYVFERGGQFHLLAENPDTFMWVSPLPNDIISCFGLVQKSCPDNHKLYRDMLICRKDYRFSKLDRDFMTELYNSKQKYL